MAEPPIPVQGAATAVDESLIMFDPFPFSPPRSLSNTIRPLSNYLRLGTLPLHIHELYFGFLLYESLFRIFSPSLSHLLFPKLYASFDKRGRLNWDAHVVSMVQCLLINGLALWVIFADPGRGVLQRDWSERLWGYNGAGGMVQGLAAGYFAWDVYVSCMHLDVMGVSSLLHAVCALVVTCIGFKPFANYYGLRFILYEVSTPFLNIHWFLDKFGLTGSMVQLYNGIALLASFFLSRLVWGSYQSVLIYNDVWKGWHTQEPYSVGCAPYRKLIGATARDRTESELRELLDVPAACREMPAWLALFYVGANTVLCALNFYWFEKMIRAVRKRFKPGEGQRFEKETAGKKGRRKEEPNGVTKDHFE